MSTKDDNRFRIDALIDKLRGQCLHRGVGGIKELGVVFRRMDTDFSKRLCFQELRCGLTSYGLEISEDDLIMLFKAFDHDKNGHIDFLEMVAKLRPPMTKSRINVVNQAFDKLDVNKDGALKLDDLKGRNLVIDFFSSLDCFLNLLEVVDENDDDDNDDDDMPPYHAIVSLRYPNKMPLISG